MNRPDEYVDEPPIGIVPLLPILALPAVGTAYLAEIIWKLPEFGTPDAFVILWTIGAGAISATALLLLRRTRYVLRSDVLEIRFAWFRHTLLLSDIETARRSGPFRSPFRRANGFTTRPFGLLEIVDTEGASTLISPRDPGAFLRELERRINGATDA